MSRCSDVPKEAYAEWDSVRENKLRESGLTREVFYRKQLDMYFRKYLTVTKAAFARAISYNRSNVGRFISGQIYSPAKHVVIAMAIELGLSDEERYDFIRCAGYDYPVDQRDQHIERLMQSGCRKLSDINDALDTINPKFVLITDTEKTK